MRRLSGGRGVMEVDGVAGRGGSVGRGAWGGGVVKVEGVGDNAGWPRG